MKQATHDAVRPLIQSSAAVLLPVLCWDAGHPDGLLDVGAGEGWWLAEYRKQNGASTACGVDIVPREPGAYDYQDETGYPWVDGWDAEAFDPLPLRRTPWRESSPESRWPLALCLEVAEHLTPEAGHWLVAELCRVAEVVIWSAAIPGQGGDGHVNEQPPSYWSREFSSQGWFLHDPGWRAYYWGHPEVAPWYQQNLLCARPHPAETAEEPRHLVHPDVLHAARQNAAWWREEALDRQAELRALGGAA